MENFGLVALAEHLKVSLGDIIIRRVIQHQPNGFIFQTRSAKLPALKVLMSAQNPALYVSEAKPPVEAPGSDFLMVLRKHLTSAELLELRKPLSERVIELLFKTAVPSKELEYMSLVLELLPNAPNIILLDAEHRILSSYSPITPQHGIGEYEPYQMPSSGNKIALERVIEEEMVSELEDFASQTDPRSWLISRVAGLGPIFAGEIVFRQRRSNRPVIEETRHLLERVRTASHSAWIYTDLPLGHILDQNDIPRLERAILSPIELQSLDRTHSHRVFANMLEAARFYFDELESRTLLEQSKLPILRELRTASKRLTDREKRLLKEQKKYNDAEALQKTAQMLTSSGMKMEQRYASVPVTDYFGDSPRKVDVPLDAALTLRENIDKMFKLHQKAGRGRQIVERQLGQIQNRRAAIGEQLRRLQAIKDWDTWLAIASKIAKEQSAGAGEPDRPEAAKKRVRSVLIEGREVLVGRSSRENDELTFHVASPDDFWLHVAEYSGSHVVVRNPSREKELPESVLTKAAQLAAYFSQARNSSKVEVHYTRRKHVTKPRRGRPGLVRLLEFKSIKVEPRNWLEEQ